MRLDRIYLGCGCESPLVCCFRDAAASAIVIVIVRTSNFFFAVSEAGVGIAMMRGRAEDGGRTSGVVLVGSETETESGMVSTSSVFCCAVVISSRSERCVSAVIGISRHCTTLRIEIGCLPGGAHAWTSRASVNDLLRCRDDDHCVI